MHRGIEGSPARRSAEMARRLGSLRVIEAEQGGLEKDIAGAARERMIDNARDMTDALVKAGVDASFALFALEDHLAAAPPAINRAIPLFLAPPQ